MQQQNETSVDAAVKRRRRREVEEKQDETSAKVKRDEPTKPEKLQTELVRTIERVILLADENLMIHQRQSVSDDGFVAS